MTRRTRRVRLSHRPRSSDEESEGENADWGVGDVSWNHDRYVYVALAPVSEDSRFGMDRRDFDADWMAVVRPRSGISDGDRLVEEDAEGEDVLTLAVVKVLAMGRRTAIYLKERGPEQ